MEELEQYTAAVKAASFQELKAMAESNRGMVAVLALQIKGVDGLQAIILKEMQERLERGGVIAVRN